MAQVKNALRLQVPLDASGIDDFRPEPVKVAIVGSNDVVLSSTIVKLDEKGKGVGQFNLDKPPAAVRVVVGPQDASDEDLVHLQTISRTLLIRVLLGDEVKIAPIVISAYYWFWWRRWCRTFVVRGRVVCPDGSPVPGRDRLRLRRRLVVVVVEHAAGRLRDDRRQRHVHHQVPLVLRLVAVVVVAAAPLAARAASRRSHHAAARRGCRTRLKPPFPSPRPDLALFDAAPAREGVARVATGARSRRSESPGAPHELLDAPARLARARAAARLAMVAVAAVVGLHAGHHLQGHAIVPRRGRGSSSTRACGTRAGTSRPRST